MLKLYQMDTFNRIQNERNCREKKLVPSTNYEENKKEGEPLD